VTIGAAYQTAHTHAVWANLTTLGRLLTSDRDRLDLIQRLSTNNLAKLAPGQGCATVFTTSIGRITDLVVVLNQGETCLLITGAGRNGLIQNWLRRNVFWNDRFQVENVTETLSHIGVFGVNSTTVVARWWPQAPTLLPYHFLEAGGTLLVRIPRPAGYWIIVPADAINIWIDRLEAQAVIPVSPEAYDALRIEAGVPGTEYELTEQYIPLELGLWDAVSFGKGCYIGQEIIARMESRGKLARMMVHVKLNGPAPVGSLLLDTDGKNTGVLTSVAQISMDEIIGLAVIKSTLAENGSMLRAQTSPPVSVRVVALAGSYEPVYQ
jgi:folate-binding protein YgfZ